MWCIATALRPCRPLPRARRGRHPPRHHAAKKLQALGVSRGAARQGEDADRHPRRQEGLRPLSGGARGAPLLGRGGDRHRPGKALGNRCRPARALRVITTRPHAPPPVCKRGLSGLYLRADPPFRGIVVCVSLLSPKWSGRWLAIKHTQSHNRRIVAFRGSSPDGKVGSASAPVCFRRHSCPDGRVATAGAPALPQQAGDTGSYVDVTIETACQVLEPVIERGPRRPGGEGRERPCNCVQAARRSGPSAGKEHVLPAGCGQGRLGFRRADRALLRRGPLHGECAGATGLDAGGIPLRGQALRLVWNLSRCQAFRPFS